MSPAEPRRTLLKAIGPGLVWAGAAVGVSHLVQSTRAGAEFGFALAGLVLLTVILKYPAFSFGPRYAAATGTSLLEGYRRRGRWALVLYLVLLVGTMFTVQAAVTLVTAAFANHLLGFDGRWLGLPALVWTSAALMAACIALLLVGHYRWLDRIVKVTILILTLSTVVATLLVIPRIDWGAVRVVPTLASWSDVAAVGFMVALVGWMPAPYDLSISHSLWTLARRRQTHHAPTVRESMIDFNIGYIGTGFLALCFLTLGAATMHGADEPFVTSGAGFAIQFVRLYTESLGAWSGPIICVAAFSVMFSTTLAVTDLLPRNAACLIARFREPEVPDRPSSISRRVYWSTMLLTAVVAGIVIQVVVGFESTTTLKHLVDLATTLSFLTAPAIALLNQLVIVGPEVPTAHRPGRGMILFSWAGILFSFLFALYYVGFLLLS